MFRRLFLDHPATVGESYAEHFGVASRFGVAMIVGGVGALVHAVVPALCKTRGSDTVRELHRQMVAKRGATAAAQTQMKTSTISSDRRLFRKRVTNATPREFRQPPG